MTEVVASEVRNRLSIVRENIEAALRRSGREGEEVKVLVASKYYSAGQISALKEAGAVLLGENRAEDLAEKQDLFGDDFEWHFIGHVQRRKAKEIVPRVSLIHSVDSVRLIEELGKRTDGKGVDVLLQINVSGEESKYGVGEDGIGDLLEAAAYTDGRVSVRGFMTLAPMVEEAEEVRYVFAKLRGIRDSLKRSWSPRFDLAELSMGMSSDYAVAVEEGATIVRIGRTLIEEDGPVRRQDGS